MRRWVMGRPEIFLWGILGLGLIVRLHNFTRSPWLDETMYSSFVYLKDARRLLEIFLFDPAAPFYRLFMFFWIRLFGDSEVSMRLVPLISGMLSIFLTYVIASRHIGKKPALLAACLLCLSAVHVWYSQDATPYAMWSFLFLLCVYSFDRLSQDNAGAIWYLVYFVSLLLTVFIQWFAIPYVVVFSLLCVTAGKKATRTLLAWNLLIVVCLVAYFALKVAFCKVLQGFDYLRPMTFFELWMLFFNWFSFGNSLWTIPPRQNHFAVLLQNPALFFSQLFFALMFIRGLVLHCREAKNLSGYAIPLFLFSLPLCAIGLSLAGFKQIYIERYLSITLPFFYMLVARGATNFKTKSVGVVSVAAVCILTAASLAGSMQKEHRGQWSVYKPNPDWRAAANFFSRQQQGSGEPVVVFAATPADGLWYYRNRFQKTAKAHLNLILYYYDRRQPLYERLLPTGAKTFYLVENTHWRKDFKFLHAQAIADARFVPLPPHSLKCLIIYPFRVPDNHP